MNNAALNLFSKNRGPARLLIVFFLLVFAANTALASKLNPYYDAKMLMEEVDKPYFSRNKVIDILSKYRNNEFFFENTIISDFLVDNSMTFSMFEPFVTEENGKKKKEEQDYIDNKFPAKTYAIPDDRNFSRPVTGRMGQSTFALASEYIREFREDLSNNDRMKLILPYTNMFLNKEPEGRTNQYLAMLREAVWQDLNMYPENMMNYFNKSAIVARLKNLLVTYSEIVIHARSGPPFCEFISSLRDIQGLKRINADIRNAISMMVFLGDEIPYYEVDKEEITLFLNDRKRFRLFTGLMLSAYHYEFKTMRTFKNKILVDYLLEEPEAPDFFRNYTENIINYLRTQQHRLNHSMLNEPDNDYVRRLINASADIIMKSVVFGKDMDFTPNTRYFTEAGDAIEMVFTRYNEILDRQYGLVFSGIRNTVQKTRADSLVFSFLDKHSQFLYALMSADREKNLSSAMDALLLPPDDYHIKREVGFSVYVNSFPGLIYYSSTGNGSSGPGLTLPFGLAINLSNGPWCSFSFYLTIFDIGPSFNMRVKDPDKYLPEVTWDEIMSPGLILTYNIPEYPIAITAGMNWGVELEETISAGESYFTKKRQAHILFGVSLDVPIWSLY